MAKFDFLRRLRHKIREGAYLRRIAQNPSQEYLANVVHNLFIEVLEESLLEGQRVIIQPIGQFTVGTSTSRNRMRKKGKTTAFVMFGPFDKFISRLNKSFLG